MQYNAHTTGRAPVGPNVVCLCLHKKGEGSFRHVQCPSHFCAFFFIILHLSKKGICSLIQQTDALTMYNVFYFRLGNTYTLIWHARTGQNTERQRSPDFDIFTKIADFCGKKCFKNKFRKYNTLYPIGHTCITNISNFVWCQRSFSSMKSVSSFSCI